jgi:glutamyl-tRNA reductase
VALLLIGLNHRTAPVDLREKLYIHGDMLYPVLTEMQHLEVVNENAILSTCNRLEIYAAVRDIVDAEQTLIRYLCQLYDIRKHELTPHLYIKQERMVVDHLMRVAAGLDSMVLGETQILGQVGDALEYAANVKTSGTLLHRMFESAMHAGKRARTETAISQNTTSVSHAAALLVRNRVKQPQPRVLVVGAGEMAELAAMAIADHGMTNLHIVNRTESHGLALAKKVNAQAHNWSALWDELARADVVISATGAPHIVLYKNNMQRVIDMRDNRPLILVDVAVPRDIDPAINEFENTICYDIDDLQQVVDESLAQREACIPDVGAIIGEESSKYWQWLGERQIVPVIKDLRQEVQNVVAGELEDAMNKLAHLNKHDKGVVSRMAHRIMNKVLHSPTVSLREHATCEDAQDFADLVRDLFALTMPEECPHPAGKKGSHSDIVHPAANGNGNGNGHHHNGNDNGVHIHRRENHNGNGNGNGNGHHTGQTDNHSSSIERIRAEA